MKGLFLITAVLLSFLQDSCGDDLPICRDLRAPFQYPDATYCPQYAELGCCGKRGERRAEKTVPCSQEKEACAEYTRNISCLTCSPFSGRMFDDSDNARIPLCRSYCAETYRKCRYSLLKIFKLRPWRDGLVSRNPETEEELERDAVAFCEKYASEAPYCYPQIMALESQHTSPRPRSPTDCVCAVPVATRLVQPQAIADPGDKSNRLFILEESGNVKILDRGLNKVLEEPLLNMTRVLSVDKETEPNLTVGIVSALYFKDSYLHIAIGRTPESKDVLNLRSYNGKIIRIDVDDQDPGKEYAIPPDNPFINDPDAFPEIYAYGFVQPWRCSVDPGDPVDGYARSDLIFPINSYTYGRDIGLVGGYMYYGCLHPNLNGKYIFGDYTGGMLIMEEDRDTGEWERHRLCIGDSSICPGADVSPLFVASLGQDSNQEIYIVAIERDTMDAVASGVLYQITDPTLRNDPQECNKKNTKFT
ncbi:HHIP-like protein 1 [Geodia barretti]|uniref:HHIP-like protein 1 n=1 Tax=Geodia barretti TaxID=519541 RepID=A0AA35SPI2_GEOBA|nr:HHIP-like protein 1 [Geodia barretti]